MAYPTALDNLSTLTGSESMTTHSSLHNEERDAIDALQTKVGVDSSAVATSLDYKVSNASSSNPGHKHTLAHGATDVTASAAELNVLDGIPGTLTATELGYVDGVTSSIQTQLNTKASLTGAETLTNKRVDPRTNTVASHATPSINTNTTDIFTITALAEAITSMTTNLSGTPVNGQKLIIRIKDNGTARAITWGASFASRGATLPTTTVLGKYQYNGFIYNSTTSTWDCVVTVDES